MSQSKLPVIVGFGGINTAGRSSCHHAYSRLVFDSLSEKHRRRTLDSIAQLMNIQNSSSREKYILDHTLVRRIEVQHFDPDRVEWNRRFPTQSNGNPVNFNVKRQNLPDQIPRDWSLTPSSVTHVNVQIVGQQDFLLPTFRDFEVKAAGQLPTGFEPGELYPSRNHPRGLQMTIYAASDTLGSLGVDWESIQERVSPDQISVYAGSAMGQLDSAGTGGMIKSRYVGQRVSSKFCALGLAEMPSDFINAYVLGSVGSTGASLGACASFLYNLRHGIHDIRSGRARVVLVGSAEAPITPEVMEGYAAMGALATDKGLRQLDKLSEDQQPNYRRACRPFSQNCGFTISESSQMLVLFDDALAMELGATMYGSAADVFVNADGFKKSISGPGVGNYITMAKAMASVRATCGSDKLRVGGFVQAHGTGTPQNRTTESEILSRVAEQFGIAEWPVAALKSYLGHSLSAASGDQINSTLGVWDYGILPGIKTIDHLADDVVSDRLHFSMKDKELDLSSQYYAIINSKGFGGNNASAAILSPLSTRKMLEHRYTKKDWTLWKKNNEIVRDRVQQWDARSIAGEEAVKYRFDHNVMTDQDIKLSDNEIELADRKINIDIDSPYPDLLID